MMKYIALILFFLISTHCHAGQIIDLEEGLTLAQINNNGALNTLAVLEDNDRTVKAVNISELAGMTGDIVSIYQQLGYKRLVEMVLENALTQSNEYPYRKLLSPAGTSWQHIALGFNYAEHADEINEEHQPFLFLKTTQATREQDISTDGNILLDYEIELCARPLDPIDDPSDLENTSFGFFICGDFTDRAQLMRGINLDNMQSGAGFNDAKSKKGYFPTGPYMVIPRDKESFLKSVKFSLYRNTVLKQDSSPTKMIWPISKIVQKAFEAKQTQRPTFSKKVDQWFIEDHITTDMVFLTGTPEGVIMRPPSLGYKIGKSFPYIFTGAFLKSSVREYVIESYIYKLLRDNSFLQPNENILMKGTYMGQVNLKIDLAK